MLKSKSSKSKGLKVKGKRAPPVKSISISSSDSTEVLHVVKDLDLAGATSKIRYQIIKWQHSQSNIQLKQMRENKEYEIVVEPSSNKGGGLTVKIDCKMCDTIIHLSVDQSNIIKLSNWICHVKLCDEDKRPKNKHIALTKFLVHH